MYVPECNISAFARYTIEARRHKYANLLFQYNFLKKNSGDDSI
jgi:hypothetical protein